MRPRNVRRELTPTWKELAREIEAFGGTRIKTRRTFDVYELQNGVRIRIDTKNLNARPDRKQVLAFRKLVDDSVRTTAASFEAISPVP